MASEWLKSLKISVINEDIDTIIKLTQNFKQNEFENLDQLNEAASLTSLAIELFKSKKVHLEGEMQKLLNAKKYAN
ncbi:hypothetical protein [Campylobacter gastrosuis]|uniref:Uncharacterized protein n=1 Tax=Campylobacter gastrosuis TaxID=2974576 RepID=A0ABT7HN74_9BACT|nr:hypothetical protein [Campylobacter gastrosuis]MDL0088377.1 hypothetical protein [Campylobacter gastrosuis]